MRELLLQVPASTRTKQPKRCQKVEQGSVYHDQCWCRSYRGRFGWSQDRQDLELATWWLCQGSVKKGIKDVYTTLGLDIHVLRKMDSFDEQTKAVNEAHIGAKEKYDPDKPGWFYIILMIFD